MINAQLSPTACRCKELVRDYCAEALGKELNDASLEREGQCVQ